MAQQMKRQNIDYKNSPIVWFFMLERARMNCDSEKAALAKSELMRLGVSVRYHRRKKQIS
jgi:hypothetical protein